MILGGFSPTIGSQGYKGGTSKKDSKMRGNPKKVTSRRDFAYKKGPRVKKGTFWSY